MYQYKTIINSSGEVIMPCILVKSGKIQNYELKKGEEIVTYNNKSLCKPFLDKNGEWVETASISEIELWNKEKEVYILPTETEILKQELTNVQEALDFIVMNGGI